MISLNLAIQLFSFTFLLPFLARKFLTNQKVKFAFSIVFLFISIQRLDFFNEFTPSKTLFILLIILYLLYYKNSRQIFGTKELLRCCIFAPFLEEFLYRKLIISKLTQQMGDLFAVLLSALVFGLAHCEFEKKSVEKFGYTFAFGLISGFLWVIDGKRLICPLVSHLICNLFGIPELLL
jgi:membrane protease YdiL (CAAX protease family)